MKKILMTFLIGLVSLGMRGINPLGVHKDAAVEMARLKMSLVYLKSVHTFRRLLLSLLGVGVCLIFLTSGFLIFHLALFNYAPWTNTTKLMVGIFLSVFYFVVTALLAKFIFSEAQWLETFNVNGSEDISPRTSRFSSRRSNGEGIHNPETSQAHHET